MSNHYDGYHGRDMNTQSVPDNRTPYLQGRADGLRRGLLHGLVIGLLGVLSVLYIAAR